jgi:hypothetical protein
MKNNTKIIKPHPWFFEMHEKSGNDHMVLKDLLFEMSKYERTPYIYDILENRFDIKFISKKNFERMAKYILQEVNKYIKWQNANQ